MPLPAGALASVGAHVAGKLAWYYGRKAAAKWAARAAALGVGGYLGYKAGERVKRIGKSSTTGSAMPRRIGAKRARGIGSRVRRPLRRQNVRGAYKRRASSAYQRPLKRRRGVRPTARRFRPSGQSGAFTGQAKLRYKRAKVTVFDKAGATHCNETHGTQAMAHCNWIGFQNCRPYELGRVIGMALCRWIYRKYYGHEFQSVQDALYLEVVGGALPVVGIQPKQIAMVWQQIASGATATGLTTTDIFNVSSTSTVQDFGTWFATNIWSDTSYGTQSPTRVLKYIGIAEETAGVNSVYYGKYIPVDKMVLTCYSYATINLQNSTTSDGGSSSTDVIDANPLVGKVYKINGFAVAPKVLTYTGDQTNTAGVTLMGQSDIWPQLSVTTVTGTTLPSGPLDGTSSWVVPPTQYQMPLPPSHFEKCKGAAGVAFEPGQTQVFKMAWKFTGLLQTLISYVYEASGNGTGLVQSNPTKSRRSIGQTLLFALEKRIKGGVRGGVGEPVPILVNYHVDHFAGAVIKGIGKSIMMRENVSLEDDNP